MVYRGYRLQQKYSLCWFQRVSSKSFQSNGYSRSPVTASSTMWKYSYHGLWQRYSYCRFKMWSYSYHKLREHTGWWALVLGKENRACDCTVTSAQKARLHTRHYLYVISKLATVDRMTQKGDRQAQRHPAMPSQTVWARLFHSTTGNGMACIMEDEKLATSR